MNKFNWLLNSSSSSLGEYLWVVILVSIVVGIIVIVGIVLTLIFQIRKTRLHKEEVDRQLNEDFLYAADQKIVLNKNNIIEQRQPQKIEYRPQITVKRVVKNTPTQTTTSRRVVTKSSSSKTNSNRSNLNNNRQ